MTDSAQVCSVVKVMSDYVRQVLVQYHLAADACGLIGDGEGV